MAVFLPTAVAVILITSHMIIYVWLISSFPSSSSPPEIFLSFRGVDTRENIASLMHDALHRGGFNAFMDEESIRTGHDIDLVIREAIKSSMGAVIVFSRNFASSEWCLEELVLILERKRELGSGYVLQPIYVDGVDPDDIHEERGCYADALAKHKKRYSYWNLIQKWKWHNKVKLWHAGLKEVAGYRGRILSGNWAKFINEMVEDIREEFMILGITVKPRPDPRSKGRMETLYELIQKLPILGRFVYENRWILDFFMRTSIVQTQTQANNSRTGNRKNDMEVLGSGIVILIGITLLVLCRFNLI